MTRLRVGLLIAAGAFLLLVGVAGTVVYVKIYRPIQAPLTAMFFARNLERIRLQNHTDFLPPGSGELTSEQVANFVAVEDAVQEQLGVGTVGLAKGQADLERDKSADVLSVGVTLLVFGDIRSVYMSAKMAQVDAMNRANFSKEEFEWVRKQLYAAAELSWSQVDVSDVIAGTHDPTVEVRQFSPGQPVSANERLARPLAPKLQAWQALAFFGL